MTKLMTKEGFELVPLHHEDKDGVVKADVQALVKKQGLEMLGVEEMLDCDDATVDALYKASGRYWLITKHGLLVQSYFDYGRRVVVVYDSSADRFGVVGVRRKLHKHNFVNQKPIYPKPKCECGVEKDA